MAFSIAEKELDIPALLDIRDMLESRKLDKRSILTYLSQFYHKFAKDPIAGAPVFPVSNGKNKATSETKLPVARSVSTPIFKLIKHESVGDEDKAEFSNKIETNNSLPCTLNSSNKSTVSNCSSGQSYPNKDDCSNTNIKTRGVETLVETSEGCSFNHEATLDKTKSNNQPGSINKSSTSQNIDAIKSLVFDNNQPESSKSVMTSKNSSSAGRESDSGVGQSSESSLSSSSTSSSRLSSVSPSFINKTNINQDISDKNFDNKTLMFRKQGANLIIKPKRSHIITNNRINSHQNNKYSQGKRSMNKSFQEAIIKFNSLSMQTDNDLENGDLANYCQNISLPVKNNKNNKQLKSQSSQTDPDIVQTPSPRQQDSSSTGQQLVSQQCQTEESHLSVSFNGSNMSNGGYKLSHAAKTPIKGSVMSAKVQGPESQNCYNIPASRSQYSQSASSTAQAGGQLRQSGQLRSRVTRSGQRQQRSKRPVTSLGITAYANIVADYHHQNDYYNRNHNYFAMPNGGVYSTLV